MPSYYCPLLDADTQTLVLDGEEFHHLSRVKRIAKHQRVLINSGKGHLAAAEVISLTKDSAELVVFRSSFIDYLKPRFAIAFSLLKNHHDELALEKCSELGAMDFFPLKTDYTVRDEGRNTLSRFRKITLAAIKQCDNPWLPVVHPVSDLADACLRIEQAGYQPVLCSEREQSQWLMDLAPTEDLCFIIGPEGGFSDQEFTQLNPLPKIRLSHLISRAETAAISIAAQFQIYRQSQLQRAGDR
jgi:16S rRNA (uracil1498-N3)-methyltransferase